VRRAKKRRARHEHVHLPHLASLLLFLLLL